MLATLERNLGSAACLLSSRGLGAISKFKIKKKKKNGGDIKEADKKIIIEKERVQNKIKEVERVIEQRTERKSRDREFSS